MPSRVNPTFASLVERKEKAWNAYMAIPGPHRNVKKLKAWNAYLKLVDLVSKRFGDRHSS